MKQTLTEYHNALIKKLLDCNLQHAPHTAMFCREIYFDLIKEV